MIIFPNRIDPRPLCIFYDLELILFPRSRGVEDLPWSGISSDTNGERRTRE